MPKHTLHDVKKIALLRANALGDFFFAYPALCALRNAYTDAEIVYLGKPWHKEFLESRISPINRVIVVPPSIGVREEKDYLCSKEELDIFFAEMKKEHFDLAIQMHGGGKYSNPFILKLGAKTTVGLKTPDASPLDISIPYDLYQNEFLKYLEVVGCIGAVTKNLHPLLSVTKTDLSLAKDYVPSKPFIVMHPGASDPRRRWPEKYFIEIGDILSRKGFSIIITGTEAEKEIAAHIISRMQKNAINLCGASNLSTLTGILALSQLVISNDSGPLHLADAVGARTVGIYWVGNAMNSSPLIRAGKKVLFSWTLLCPFCHTNCIEKNCGHEVSFVEDIKPKQVIEAAYQLLQ